MKMNRQNLKLTPIRLMAGAGLLMASFLSEATALPFKCARCNMDRNLERCATDSKFFEECAKRCPKDPTQKKDPIQECRDAHDHAMLTQPDRVHNILRSGTCEEKQHLIETHNQVLQAMGKSGFNEKEKEAILGKVCFADMALPADKVKLHHDALSAAVQNRQLKKTEEEVEEKVKPNATDAKPTSNIDPKFAQRMQKIHDQEKLQELLKGNKTPQQIRDIMKAEAGLFHDPKFVEEELKKEEEKHK